MGGRLIEGGIKTKPRHQTGPGQRTHLVEQLQYGITAVCDTHHLPLGQPADDQSDDVPGPFDQRSMMAVPLFVEALGGAQHRHEGQRPDPLSPGHVGEQHTTRPTPTTDVHKMRPGGAHGIAGDAFRMNVSAVAALDSVIEATDDDAPRDKHGDEEPPQQPAGGQR